MIEKIVRYTQWANERITNILREVEEKEFHQELNSLFVNDTNCPTSSIRSLVEHVLMGLNFSTHVMRESSFRPDEIIDSLREMTKDDLLDKLADVSREFVTAFETSYGNTVEFKKSEIAIDEDFVFAFTNHVVYHRGQINIALKMIGSETDDADYSKFIRDRE
ncbi:MAG: DinB family protein [Promethearchaeati archaeon]